MNNFVPNVDKWVNYYFKQARGGIQDGGNLIHNIGSKPNVPQKDSANLFLPNIGTTPENESIITRRVEANLQDMSEELNQNHRQRSKLIKRKPKKPKSSNVKKLQTRKQKPKTSKQIKRNKKKIKKRKTTQKSNKKNQGKIKYRNHTIF